ncbi:hypothetical protein EJD97_011413 [Solanum chilense]|uniref:Tf2-1-like SH3-like domain-containing protein n=1 Tax=Solanum chilense TaxID=4083 RepID=A0A6N2BI06_SOLCI|nr:hypothetical protein EJD97_011413 [Solanum chilense]
MSVLYHPDKVNVVVDALSRITMGSASHVQESKKDLVKDIHRFWRSFQKWLGIKVKLSTAFHPQMDGQAEHTIQTLEDMIRDCIIDFKNVQMIRNWLKTYLRPKNYYTDDRIRDLEFEEDDKVYLKISSMKGWVGNVAYELRLPIELASVHPVFHASMLKKCISDPESILPIEGLGVEENLSYKDSPVEILDRQVKKFSNKEVASVKVLWKNHLVEGATWEAEADMKSRYPHTFDN